MSDTTRLNVSITATDSQAQTSLKSLQTTVKQLEGALQQLGAISANASTAAAVSIQRETAAIREKIAVLNQEIAVKQASSSVGIRAAQQEAAYINRDIDLANRAAQARIAASNARVRQEIADEDRLAVYTNRNMDLARTAALNEANYINRNKEVAATKARAEADYANQHINLVADQQRTEAEYINRNHDLAYARMRQEADYENQAFDARARRQGGIGGRAEGQDVFRRELRHGVAAFDEMASGRRGQFIGTLGAAARDAGLSVGALGTSVAALGAVMAGAAILRGAENMGKWATETRAAASAAGMSVSSYSELQGALTLTGMKSTEADATLRRLAINLSTAIADPTSKAAEGFHALGISQEQLVATGGDVDKALQLLADAFTRTADGANKSAAYNAAAGRGFVSLFKLIQDGGMSLDELKAKAKELGLNLTDETAKSLEETGRAVEELSNRIKGDAIQAFVDWGPIIEATTTLLGGLFGMIGKIVSAPVVAVKAAGQALANMQAQPGFGAGTEFGAFPMPGMEGVPLPGMPGGTSGGLIPEAADALRDRMAGKAIVPPMPGKTAGGQVTALETMRLQMAQAGAGAHGRDAEQRAEIAVMQRTLAQATLTAKEKIQVETELAQKQIALNNETTAAGAHAAKQSYADFASAEQLKVSEAQGSSAKIKATYDEWISAAISRYNQLGSVVDKLRAKELEQVNAAKRGEIMQGVRRDEQQAKLSDLNAQLASLQSGQTLSRGAEKQQGPSMDRARAQEYVAQAQAVDAEYQKQIAALKQYGATADQVVGMETQAKEKEISLYTKAAEASQQATQKILAPFTTLLDSMASQTEQFSRSLLTAFLAPQVDLVKRGLTSVKVSEQGNEIRAAFRNIFVSVANSFGQAMESAIGNTIARSLSGGAANTIGDLLKQTFSKIVGNAAGNVAGGATSGALTATSMAAVITTPLSTILTGGFGTMTGLLSTIAVNTALTAVKPQILGTSYSAGGIVPSAAGGMLVGGNGATLAVLHAREMVLPEHLSKGFQNMLQGGNRGGGNNANLNYSPTINTSSRSRSGTGMTRSEFGQMMSLHGGAMLGEARNLMRNGWRPA